MIYYFILVVLVFSAVVICGYEGTSKKLMFTLLTFVVISIIGLSINNGEGWKKTIFTNHNKTISKEIKVEELSIKNENITIFLDDNYKILIHKNQGNHKYNCEVSKGSEKLNGVKIYGFHELLESVDKIKSKSHKVKVTFDFSESNGDLNNIHFKSIPNDFEIDY